MFSIHHIWAIGLSKEPPLYIFVFFRDKDSEGKMDDNMLPQKFSLNTECLSRGKLIWNIDTGSGLRELLHLPGWWMSKWLLWKDSSKFHERGSLSTSKNEQRYTMGFLYECVFNFLGDKFWYSTIACKLCVCCLQWIKIMQLRNWVFPDLKDVWLNTANAFMVDILCH